MDKKKKLFEIQLVIETDDLTIQQIGKSTSELGAHLTLGEGRSAILNIKNVKEWQS